MKNILKKILKKIGLWSLLKKAQPKGGNSANNISEVYKNRNQWSLQHQGVEVHFDITDSYSKKWFLPRYDHGKIHEPVATDIFIDRIKSSDVVFDIGGHLGYFSCLAAVLAPQGQVHVFEVDPKCLKLIEKNVAHNHLQNVKINNLAVSDHQGVETIPVAKNPNPSLVIGTSENTMDIPATTIDAYISQHRIAPKFLKIDVEGAEWKVLRGMEKLLEQPVELLVEIHVSNLAKYFETDYKEIIQYLLDFGYNIERVDAHRNTDSNLTQVDLDTELSGNTMLFCTKTKTA